MNSDGSDAARPQILWCPTWRQGLAVAATAGLAIGYAAMLRYFSIKDSSVALTCDAVGGHWLCGSRKIAIAFSQSSAFGVIALIAAALNLLRPSIILVMVGVASAGFGLVLYNTATSAVATALLIVSLARPAPEPE